MIQVWLSVFHPFYVSITSIDHNQQAQRVEISCRIFFDDLEAALKADSHREVDLIKGADRQVIDSLLGSYLRRHLRLSVNGKALQLQYLGYEIEDDVAWCYLEAGNVPRVRQLTVDNRLLLDQFPKQSNIMHVTANGQRKSTKLDNPERHAVFEF